MKFELCRQCSQIEYTRYTPKNTTQSRVILGCYLHGLIPLLEDGVKVTMGWANDIDSPNYREHLKSDAFDPIEDRLTLNDKFMLPERCFFLLEHTLLENP